MKPPICEVGIQLGQILVLCEHDGRTSHEPAKIAYRGNAESEGREWPIFASENLVVKILHIHRLRNVLLTSALRPKNIVQVGRSCDLLLKDIPIPHMGVPRRKQYREEESS